MAIYFFSLILTLFTGAKERERETERWWKITNELMTRFRGDVTHDTYGGRTRSGNEEKRFVRD